MNEYTFDYVERNRLDAFCKTVLRNEAITYLSELARRRDREKPLDTLPQAEMDKLCTLDEYPSDSFMFSAFGYYDGYMNKLCTRTLYELDGTPHVRVDEYMKHRLQNKLIRAILKDSL